MDHILRYVYFDDISLSYKPHFYVT